MEREPIKKEKGRNILLGMVLSWQILFASQASQANVLKNVGALHYPMEVTRDHHNELQGLMRNLGFLHGEQLMRKFIKVLEQDYLFYKEQLNEKAQLLIQEVLKRCKLYLKSNDEQERFELLTQILEFSAAYSNFPKEVLQATPEFPRHAFFQSGIHPFFENLSFHIIFNKEKRGIFAPNLADEKDQLIPVSKLKDMKNRDRHDPKTSVIWNKMDIKNHEVISDELMKLREELCHSDQVYEYWKQKKAPEEGGGINPGVKVTTTKRGTDEKIKLSMKFAMRTQKPEDVFFHPQEAYIEPAGNALFQALGFNVEKGVFCPSVKVKFDDGFLDLTQSKSIPANLWNMKYYFEKVILEDGQVKDFEDVVSSYTFMDHVHISARYPWGRPEVRHKIKDEFVGKIAYFITHGVYLKLREKKVERIQGWKRNYLSHEDRRELRGLILFETWLGSIDNHGSNLKIFFKEQKDPTQLFPFLYVLSDNGNIFAPHDTSVDDLETDLSDGYFPAEMRVATRAFDMQEFDRMMKSYKGQSPLEIQVNRFNMSLFKDGSLKKNPPTWFTEEEKLRRLSEDVILLDYEKVKKVYQYVTWEDLKWAVRKMASLSEEQILKAMCLGGLGYPGAKLMTEKLVFRRDQLVKYFELDKEIPLLRPEGPDLYLTQYGEGEITYRTRQGQTKKLKVPSNGFFVLDGVFHTSVKEN